MWSDGYFTWVIFNKDEVDGLSLLVRLELSTKAYENELFMVTSMENFTSFWTVE